MKTKYKFKVHCDCDGENFCTVVALPFIPQIGMMMAVISGDNFRRVDDVYWDPIEGFEMYFEDEETCRTKQMLEFGWEKEL